MIALTTEWQHEEEDQSPILLLQNRQKMKQIILQSDWTRAFWPGTWDAKFSQIWNLRVQWGLSAILTKNNKSVWSNVFWYVKVYIFWKFIQYTKHWDKIQMLKKNSSDKISIAKNALFSFASSNSSVLLLIRNSYASWSTRLTSLKLCWVFSTFN